MKRLLLTFLIFQSFTFGMGSILYLEHKRDLGKELATTLKKINEDNYYQRPINNQDINKALNLIKKGADPYVEQRHILDASGRPHTRSALYYALWITNPIFLKTFLESGLDPNISFNDSTGFAGSPLHYVVRVVSDKPEKIRLLLSYAADANQFDEFDYTPLMRAAAVADIDTVKLLLQGAVPINKEYEKKLVELRKPNSYLGLLPVDLIKNVTNLITNQANPHIKNQKGETAKSVAIENLNNLTAGIPDYELLKANYEKIISILP